MIRKDEATRIALLNYNGLRNIDNKGNQQQADFWNR
jgi:hypothetical protein